MASPFPGMDPYLEQPGLWPDVHFRLIAELGNQLSERVGTRYFVAVEPRSYLLGPDEIALIGRPDLGVVETVPEARPAGEGPVGLAIRPRSVTVPTPEEIRERYLEIRDLVSGDAVTVVAILSPSNKRAGTGRAEYLRKRFQVLGTRTSLVEIDLLRAGIRPSVEPDDDSGDYRILVARGWQRPRADLFSFTVRQPIPTVPVPLSPGEDDVVADLRAVLDTIHERVGYARVVDYTSEPTPPLATPDRAWADELLREAGCRPDPP